MKRSALLVLGLAGCAMSRSAYQDRSMEVAKRNDDRFNQAVAELKRRGYELLLQDDDMRYASLERDDGKRCLVLDWKITTSKAEPLTPDERLRITIGEATRGAEQPKPPVNVTARAEEACAFFKQGENGKGELEVTKEDGQKARIVHTERRIVARAANGELVRVDIQPKVISTTTVTVNETCDRSPGLERDPLEHPFGVPVLWAPAPALRTVVMIVEREELKTECSDYVY